MRPRIFLPHIFTFWIMGNWNSFLLTELCQASLKVLNIQASTHYLMIPARTEIHACDQVVGLTLEISITWCRLHLAGVHHFVGIKDLCPRLLDPQFLCVKIGWWLPPNSGYIFSGDWWLLQICSRGEQHKCWFADESCWIVIYTINGPDWLVWNERIVLTPPIFFRLLLW